MHGSPGCADDPQRWVDMKTLIDLTMRDARLADPPVPPTISARFSSLSTCMSSSRNSVSESNNTDHTSMTRSDTLGAADQDPGVGVLAKMTDEEEQIGAGVRIRKIRRERVAAAV